MLATSEHFNKIAKQSNTEALVGRPLLLSLLLPPSTESTDMTLREFHAWYFSIASQGKSGKAQLFTIALGLPPH